MTVPAVASRETVRTVRPAFGSQASNVGTVLPVAEPRTNLASRCRTAVVGEATGPVLMAVKAPPATSELTPAELAQAKLLTTPFGFGAHVFIGPELLFAPAP